MGGLGQKSREDAINLVQKIVEGNPGDLRVMKDTSGQEPKVLSIKFVSRDYAELFVREYSGQNPFPHKYDNF